MSIRRLIPFAILAMVGLGARSAHAQAAPIGYLSGSLAAAGRANNYGDVSGLAGNEAAAAISGRYNLANGFFVGSERTGLGLNPGAFTPSAYGQFGSLAGEGVQFGYNFQNAPVTVYAGFDTLKYNTSIGSAFSPFETATGTGQGYGAHAGVEFRPTSNLSLSLGFGYTQQQSGRVDSDINSPLLPGASPLFATGRR